MTTVDEPGTSQHCVDCEKFAKRLIEAEELICKLHHLMSGKANNLNSDLENLLDQTITFLSVSTNLKYVLVRRDDLIHYIEGYKSLGYKCKNCNRIGSEFYKAALGIKP